MFVNNAKNICKTILRNGYDAYLINISLQQELYDRTGVAELSIACDADFETLSQLFSNLQPASSDREIAQYYNEESEILYRFYATDVHDCSHPESAVMRLTGNLLDRVRELNTDQFEEISTSPSFLNSDRVFYNVSCGSIRLNGIPVLTLHRNYALAIRALRMAANYDLPIEPNTWTAIVQNAENIVNYVPASVFVEEWKQVAAESMWRFIELLQESTILQGLMPEIAALTAIKQNKSKNILEEETVFEFTIRCMKFYPEENLHHDWIGVVATLFHQVGKLYSAEKHDGRWLFFQHHRIGAKVANMRLRKLGFDCNDVDTICNVISNHIRFQSMMADRGIHKFLEIMDKERLIELSRAQIKATPDGNYTNFNHNIKYMDRGEQPLQKLKPFLNGNEIMECTKLAPGRIIGDLREALLNAQICGDVNNREEAIEFVKNNAHLF